MQQRRGTMFLLAVLTGSTAGPISACGRGPTGGAGPAGSGGAGAEPLPYQLYFVRYGLPTLGGLAVDDEYIYFHWGDVSFMRVRKDGGGEIEPFVRCGCDSLDLIADGGYLYLLGGTYVLRVNVADKTETRADLLWDHTIGGDLMLDDRYVYTTMHGCAAITRIDKRTFAYDPDADVMYIDDIEYPTSPGETILERVGNGLVCGSPNRLYVIDEWGGPARIVHEGYEGFWGLRPVGDDVYWIQGGSTAAILGRARLPEGAPELFPLERGHTTRQLLYVAPIERIVWGGARGSFSGLRTFDLLADTVEPELPIGSLVDIAMDGEAIYATAVALSEVASSDGATTSDYANWIVRIPFTELSGPR